ncbi:hypothetical protein GIY23_07780 [Allosaccharopolyspora coralli]|uniref:VanZ-like domain-containing protein n=1 Tax=Allosaccharopolyspora coralli TaxID=2665642 RepID=A0A5Q3Q7M0_9PSEU|nr:hypothetical protein GIY23_07780 [Allosaccharopolyspora coralli]
MIVTVRLSPKGGRVSMHQAMAAHGGIVPLLGFAVPLVVLLAVLGAVVRGCWLRPTPAIRLSALDAALVLSVIAVTHLVWGARTPVAPTEVRVVPGSDLLVAVQAEPGAIWPWIQLLGNLFLLFTVGFVAPMRCRWLRDPRRVAVGAAVAACVIETVQYVALTGRVVSADDVLLNTSGAVLGACCARPWWSAPTQRESSGECTRQEAGVNSTSAISAATKNRSGSSAIQPVTRRAASFPDNRTVGTPTPGVVPEPASTTLSYPRTRLRGRNGPVWAKVCAAENGVPAACPDEAQSGGVTRRCTSTESAKPVKPRRSSTPNSSSR